MLADPLSVALREHAARHGFLADMTIVLGVVLLLALFASWWRQGKG